MSEWLSEDDIDRINQFANTPAYARTPEMLAPDEAEE